MSDDAPRSLTPLPSPQSLVDLVKHTLPRLDLRIEAAFLGVPRQHFLPNVPPERVYDDVAIPTKVTPDGIVTTSSSQPSMMAIMLQQLHLRPGDNVLEIGGGTGYNAALIQHIIGDNGHVTSIEIDPDVANTARTHLQHAAMTKVNIVVGDGAQGYAPRAAYDRILSTTAIRDVPRAWVRQLRPNGRLVAPIWIEGFQVSAAFDAQRDGSLFSADNAVCSFVWIQGRQAASMTMRVPGGLYLDTSANIDAAAIGSLLSDDAETGYLSERASCLELWHGFLPYLTLHLPEGMTVVSYHASNRIYGIEGGGFALVSPGSACFVQLDTTPVVRYFGAVDTYLAMQDALTAWIDAGQPSQSHLRLRMIPIDAQPSGEVYGRVYTRSDHLLQVWMED